MRRGSWIAAFAGVGVMLFAACGARTGLTNLTDDASVDAAALDGPAVTADVATDPGPPTRINGIALGDSHSCARRADGSVACWGKNLNGQLGNGTMSVGESTPVAVVGLSDAVELAAGTFGTCARRAGGTVMCWGDNSYGQLGNGTQSPSAVPTPVSGITDAIEIVAGAYHFCVRTSGGSALCWGRNDFGEVGNGSDGPPVLLPTPVVGLPVVAALGAGDFHTCAVLTGGTVECWGDNSNGQLGDATLKQQDSPVPVKDLTGAQEVAGGVTHTCARALGAVFCWGVDARGQLGYGLYDGGRVSSLTPVNATGVSIAVQIGAADSQTCARNSDGTLLCWGQNDVGQLGEGVMGDAVVPTLVMSMFNAVELALGSEHTCARTMGDAVYCWGQGASGQLGNGSMDFQLVPTPVVGL